MDDLGILARDFGIRPQGKSAPMAASKSSVAVGSSRSASVVNTWNKPRSGPNWTSTSPSDPLFSSGGPGGGLSGDRIPTSYDDVFTGPPRKSSSPPSIDSIFDGYNKDPAPKSSSMPVFDKPVYDDDIFDGVPGIKSSSSIEYDDVFASMGSAPERVSSPPYDDLLDSLGKGMPVKNGSGERRSGESKEKEATGFEELLPGFGGRSQPQKRQVPKEDHQEPAKPTTSVSEEPFVVLETIPVNKSSGTYDYPLDQFNRSMSSGGTNINIPPVGGGVFDDFDGLGESAPSFPTDINENSREKDPYKVNQNTSPVYNFSEKPPQRSSLDTFENFTPKSQPTKTSETQNSVGRHSSQSSSSNSNAYDQNLTSDQSPKSHQHAEAADDVWLTVSEIPLFTKPTSAPPPSRLPPSIASKKSPFVRIDDPASGLSGRRNDISSFTQGNQSYSFRGPEKGSNVSSMEEPEDFATVKPQRYPNEQAEVFSPEEDIDANLRDAMGRAEAKFRHAKEVRERERDAKSARNRDYVPHERVETTAAESLDLDDREKQEELDRERLQREMEEKEKEQRRIEKERERELERERERARQAVERATREARERSAAEARQKAERAAAEKARQQSERLAFQRASGEARERAANEAKERVEKAKSAAAREKAAAEAREKAVAERAAAERAAAERATAEARKRAAERATVERVAAEARDRAAVEAREKAAAAARERQNKAENDLEAFFSMGSRATSAPKQRAATSDNFFDAQFQSKGTPETTRSTSSGSNLNMKKASSVTNIVDDLSSIFGASQSPGEFPAVEGETEERRRARYERHQRTRERAAKALAEKNERDMQMQRDQAERHRMAETLDFEIRRWAAGKDGNLRALLSTLQYVLWPECGWQPVSLTDLITAAAVKKVYRKATLCIHPDKVQQKGANLQQKYIAEKVFDLLKEAWNKFNSEELF